MIPKAQKKLGLRKYLALAFILVILALWTYIFNKLFDRLFGNFDILDVYYLLGWILLLAFGFGASLWYVDTKGMIARMFGQGADLWKIHMKREGFKLEVTGSSSQEVE